MDVLNDISVKFRLLLLTLASSTVAVLFTFILFARHERSASPSTPGSGVTLRGRFNCREQRVRTHHRRLQVRRERTARIRIARPHSARCAVSSRRYGVCQLPSPVSRRSPRIGAAGAMRAPDMDSQDLVLVRPVTSQQPADRLAVRERISRRPGRNGPFLHGEPLPTFFATLILFAFLTSLLPEIDHQTDLVVGRASSGASSRRKTIRCAPASRDRRSSGAWRTTSITCSRPSATGTSSYKEYATR